VTESIPTQPGEANRSHLAAMRKIQTALPVVLLIATILAQLQWPLMWDRFGISHAVVALAAASMLTHALLINALRAFAACGAVMATAWLIETFGVATSFPFGSYRYAVSITYHECPRTELCSDSARATHQLFAIAGVPLIVLLAWFMMGYAAHMAARRMSTHRWAQWAWASLMLAAWDLYLDPQFILDPHLSHGWWQWLDPTPHLPGVPGIPLTNYFGWLLAAGIIQAVFMAALGPTRAPRGRWDVPTVFIVWTWIGGAIAVGWFLRQMPAAVWGASALAPAMVVLLRSCFRRSTDSREVLAQALLSQTRESP